MTISKIIVKYISKQNLKSLKIQHYVVMKCYAKENKKAIEITFYLFYLIKV